MQLTRWALSSRYTKSTTVPEQESDCLNKRQRFETAWNRTMKENKAPITDFMQKICIQLSCSVKVLSTSRDVPRHWSHDALSPSVNFPWCCCLIGWQEMLRVWRAGNGSRRKQVCEQAVADWKPAATRTCHVKSCIHGTTLICFWTKCPKGYSERQLLTNVKVHSKLPFKES